MAGNLREAARKAASRNELPTKNFLETKFFKMLAVAVATLVVIIFINFQNSSNDTQESIVPQFNESSDQGKGGEAVPENTENIEITYGQLNELETTEGGTIFVPSEALSVANASAAAFLSGRWEGIPTRGSTPDRLDVYSDFTLNQPIITFAQEGEVILMYRATLSSGEVKNFQIPLLKEDDKWFYVGYN